MAISKESGESVKKDVMAISLKHGCDWLTTWTVKINFIVVN